MRTIKTIANLEQLLRAGRIGESIELMTAWLAAAALGEPQSLLTASTAPMRPRVTSLMRDVLSGYPDQTLGCPILIYAEPELELDSPRPPCLTLPPPHSRLGDPRGMQFLGWLPVTAQIPIPLPLRQSSCDTDIPWSTPSVAVALFRTRAEDLDSGSVDVPASWWGELFLYAGASVRLEGRLLLPYPDAIEAAEVMQAAARGETAPPHCFFLGDRAWAQDEGVKFRRLTSSRLSP